MWAVIASGQSLTLDDVECVKFAREDGRIKGVIAVSNVGIDLAPWADALVSHDTAWWVSHRYVEGFKGRKFSRNKIRGCEQFIPDIKSGCNSGYMAMCVARDIFFAKRIVLLGFDMHGTHYFGPHKDLRNTSAERFKIHIEQFNKWVGPHVINCTPNSSLKKFPFANLRDVV